MTAAGVGLTWLLTRPAPTPQQPVRINAALGIDGTLIGGGGNAVALSPDGSLLALIAQPTGGRTQLYVRRMDQLQATPVPGTEDATSPFFSPDGQWIGFFAGAKLKKIHVNGGATVTLADAPTGRGAWWVGDDTIVFQPARDGAALLRISSSGGPPTPIGTLADGEVTQRWPQVLPDGKAVLFTGNSSAAGGFYNANLVIQTLPAGTRRVVQRGGSYGRYLPSGHLVYVSEGTLFAAPFDLDRYELTGQAVPVIEKVVANAGSGAAQFAVSDRGTLVYAAGAGDSGGFPIYWMDRQGRVTVLRSRPEPWANIRFAPDGAQLAVETMGGSGRPDVWILDWARDTFTRLTSDPASDGRPVWTPDSRRIVFSSDRAGRGAQPNLYWQRADGTGDVQRLTESPNPQGPGSWHPSGRFLAFQEGPSGIDLFILPMEGDEASGWKPGKPTPFVTGPFSERDPMFSPDGRWIAYSSNESGRDEIYVRPFPGPGGRVLISTGGGALPTWSRKRNELFYSTPDRQIMMTPYRVEGEAFRSDKPQLWATTRYVPRGGPNFRTFDLHPDGERFALSVAAETQATAPRDTVVFVFNFFDELRRVAPLKKMTR